MKKRILALLLAVLMVLALFPMSVFAEDKYEIANGDFWNGDQKVSVNELIQAETDINVVSHNEEGENTCVVVMLDGEAYYEPVVSDEVTVEFPVDVCYGGVSTEPDGDCTEYVHAFETYVEEVAVEEIENTAVLGEESAPEETEELIDNEAELLPEEETPANEDLIENEAELLPEEVPEELPEEEISEEIVENEEKTGEPTLEEEVGEKAEEEPEMLFATAPLGTPAPETYTVTYVPFEFEDISQTLEDQTSLSEADLAPWTGERADLYAEFVGWYYYEEVGTGLLTAEKPTLVTPKHDLTEEETDQIVNNLKENNTLTVRKNATAGMVLEKDITLYGNWKYNVTFKPGEGGTGTMESVQKSFDDDYPAPECAFTAPEGKVFRCWEISLDNPADDYTEEIDPGDYAPALYGTWYGNVTLTALWENKEISVVDAAPVVPLAGAKPNYSAVAVTSDPANAIKEVSIEWFGFNGRKLDKNTVFKAGMTYTAMIRLTADNEHTFAEDAAFENGDIRVSADGTKAVLLMSWTLPMKAPKVVDRINAFIEEPVIGKEADEDVTFTYGKTVTAPHTDATATVEWYEVSGGKETYHLSVFPFEAGKTYRVKITTHAPEGCVFSKSTVAFVAGNKAEIAFDQTDTTKATISYIWKLIDPTAINEIDAFVDAPKAGEKPDRIAKYKTLPEGGIAAYGDVIWYVSYTGSCRPKDWTRMKKGSAFKADRYYLAAFNVEAKKDGLPFLADLDVKVNGEKVADDDVIVNTEKGTAYFEYIWYIEEVKETKISHVEAKIDSPVVGERPDYTASFLSAPKNALEAYEVTWYVYDAKHGDWDRMSSKETFKKGETYGVKIEVYADDEYIFKKSVTGNINGFEHDERACDIYDPAHPYEIAIFHSWKNISDKYTVTGTEDWYKGSKESLSFRSSASFKKFKGVKMDGALIAEKNYTAESGSTIVALKPSYLETLALGYHTVTIVSTDGEVSMEFEVHGDQKLKCKHSVSKLSGMKEATCTEKGYTGDRICKSCGAILEKGKVIPAAGHHYVNGTCTECGMRKDREKNPDTGASLTSLAVAAVLAGAAAVLAGKKRK